jgi:hypothetical protein
MDVDIHAIEDVGSSDHHKVVAAEGATETDRAGNTVGVEHEDFPDQECSKETDEAGYWPREPGDRWG